LTFATEGHASRGGLRLGGALLLLLLAVAACGSSGAGAVGAGAAPVKGSAAAPIATPAASAGELLAAALAPLRAASVFETSVTVDGKEVLSATGRSVGGASQTAVTTTGRTVDYVVMPKHAWAREPGHAWVAVETKAAPATPLDILSSPTTLAAGASDGAGLSLVATYPAAALGLSGDPVTVTVTSDGGVVRFTYESTTSGHPMTSTTTLRPAPADPIAAPDS